MASAPQDLAFVARLLGEAAAPAQDPVTEAKPPSKAHKRYRDDANAGADSEDEQTRKFVLDKYSKPTKRGPKQWLCEASNCNTAARERDWDVHIHGIKHKRQLVSMMHTGQLGNTVVSLFEADPGILRQELQPKHYLPAMKPPACAYCSARLLCI